MITSHVLAYLFLVAQMTLGYMYFTLLYAWYFPNRVSILIVDSSSNQYP